MLFTITILAISDFRVIISFRIRIKKREFVREDCPNLYQRRKDGFGYL